MTGFKCLVCGDDFSGAMRLLWHLSDSHYFPDCPTGMYYLCPCGWAEDGTGSAVDGMRKFLDHLQTFDRDLNVHIRDMLVLRALREGCS